MSLESIDAEIRELEEQFRVASQAFVAASDDSTPGMQEARAEAGVIAEKIQALQAEARRAADWMI